MNISIDKFTRRYINTMTNNKKDEKVDRNDSLKKNFDEVVISNKGKQISEDQVRSEAVQQTMLQAREGTSTKKLEQLKQSIADGKYRIDSEAIAEKLLMGD